MVVNLKGLAVGTVQRGLVAVLEQPCIEITGYAPVLAGITVVGSDIHLNHIV